MLYGEEIKKKQTNVPSVQKRYYYFRVRVTQNQMYG